MVVVLPDPAKLELKPVEWISDPIPQPRKRKIDDGSIKAPWRIGGPNLTSLAQQPIVFHEKNMRNEHSERFTKPDLSHIQPKRTTQNNSTRLNINASSVGVLLVLLKKNLYI